MFSSKQKSGSINPSRKDGAVLQEKNLPKIKENKAMHSVKKNKLAAKEGNNSSGLKNYKQGAVEMEIFEDGHNKTFQAAKKFQINNDIQKNGKTVAKITDKERLRSKLLLKKRQILRQMQTDFESLISGIDPEILALNSNLFLQNINKNFQSDKPLIKRRPDIPPRPSILIQLNDQTLLWDANNPEFRKNLPSDFVEDLENVINKYYPCGYDF